jgi:type I restriction enzyme M protein
MKKFENLKRIYDKNNKNVTEIKGFLPVHMNEQHIAKQLLNKNGTRNEEYYKWQFLDCFVSSGACSKDFIGVEIQWPKGNKSSKPIKMDAVIFDDKDWFVHYKSFNTIKDDSKWDERDWLQDHMICAIEFKKENSKDVKGVVSSQLKAYMSESTKENVMGILYDEGRLYLFKMIGKKLSRYSDEFNIEKNGKVIITYDLPDGYENLPTFKEMCNLNTSKQVVGKFNNRKLKDLSIISKTDSKKLNDALYEILHAMDKCGLVNQKGYNILIQLLALKIFDEKNHKNKLQYFVNISEERYSGLADVELQNFIERIEAIRNEAKHTYSKILGKKSYDIKNENQVKVIIQIVKQFQNYSFSESKKSNLYQLVFYRFASQFSKADNAQFITPLQIIDFIVEVVNPRNNESIIDPTVGIADFLSVSYVKSEGTLKDENIYGIDIDEDMVKLATLNMLLNGDGQATIESVSDGLGSINSKYDTENNFIKLVPRISKKKEFNYNGDWDNRPDTKEVKKFDIVLTNPPFGDARAWAPKGNDKKIAECYELWNIYNKGKIDLGVIFLENAFRILKEEGRMAIVLSNSIASIKAHEEARKWLLTNMRVVAMFDLPGNIFAEAGVSPTIIVAYKPKAGELDRLIKADYEIFSREIKKVGYEVKTIKKVKTFVTQYKVNPKTFKKEINIDGTPVLDEDFSKASKDFKVWCNKQEDSLKKLFL